MTLVEVLFALLGAMALGSAVLVAVSNNLVHCALWLVVTLGALAGCYLLLAAEFLAWVQVLIYVGAVVVLLLFGLMLTHAPIGRSTDLDSGNRILAALVASATGAVLVTVVVSGLRGAYVDLERSADSGAGASQALGDVVFRVWVLPFEVLSVLLLAALVGAVVLSRRDSTEG